MIARTIHLTAIAVLVLAPLTSVLTWEITLTLVGLALWLLVAGFIEDLAAWLDGLEAEGL